MFLSHRFNGVIWQVLLLPVLSVMRAMVSDCQSAGRCPWSGRKPTWFRNRERRSFDGCEDSKSWLSAVLSVMSCGHAHGIADDPVKSAAEP